MEPAPGKSSRRLGRSIGEPATKDIPPRTGETEARLASCATSKRAEQAADELRFIAPPQFVLPDTDHRPAASAQRTINAAVAGLVGGDLVPPERGVGLRLGRVPRAAVPETTVDEDGGAEQREDEVRAARQLGASAPAGDAVRPENLDQPQLGALVARVADAGHDFGAFDRSEDVVAVGIFR